MVGRSLNFVLWSLESVTKDGERWRVEEMRKQKPNILDDACYRRECVLLWSRVAVLRDTSDVLFIR